jgi:sigma-E factor negative regulatory protein RseB
VTAPAATRTGGGTGRGRRCAALAGGLAGALALAVLLTGDPAAARRVRSDPGAVGLLRAAADAAQRVPYEGSRFLTTWNRSRSATSRATVAHRPGEGIRYRSADGGGTGHRPESTAGASTGFTPETLALLTRNYSVVRAADGVVCGRRARVVEARRPDGSPAGRFWLDRETGLMLHRELIDATGRPVVVTGFTEISFTTPPPEPPVRVTPRGGLLRFPGSSADDAADAAGAWGERLDATGIAWLRDRGWPVPSDLPGRLTLFDVRREKDGGSVHLSYSDGLAAVSVFVQRGALDEAGMSGWQKTVRRGRTVYRRESLRRWAVSAGKGYVFTVLTDAPQSTADAVAVNMPRGGPDTLWKRLSRGTRRLVSAANPFD